MKKLKSTAFSQFSRKSGHGRLLLASALLACLLYSSLVSTSVSGHFRVESTSPSLPVLSPREKVDPALLTALDKGLLDPTTSVSLIVTRVRCSSLTLEAFATYLEETFNVVVESRLDVVEGVVVRGPAITVLPLASSPHVARVWRDEEITVHDYQTQVYGALGSPRSATVAGGFVNFTAETGAQDLWSLGYNGSGINIAVLDAGVDIMGNIGEEGGDLGFLGSSTPKFIGAVSMVPEEPLYYTDFMGRGSFHAGLAVGSGQINSSHAGMAPGANYLNVKVYDSAGITYWSFVVSGIDWALKHGADIILFCASIPGYYDDPVSLAINNVVDKGVIVVAPAGDEGPAYMSIDTPGQALKALTVGAYNSSSGTVAEFSSRGPCLDFRTGPDLVAPGVDVIGVRSRVAASSYGNIDDLFTQFGFNVEDLIGFSFDVGLPPDLFPQPSYGTPIDENYTRASGTGAAAAITAGGIALLLQAFPFATPELLRVVLQRTATKLGCDENTEGAGLLDLVAAFQYMEAEFFTAGHKDIYPLTSPLIYPGVVASLDYYNTSSNATLRPAGDYNCYDSGLLLSSQMMASAAFVTNVSDANFTSIHLPLNQFGVRYSSNYTAPPLIPLMEPVTGSRFAWFSQFEVLREMHLVTESGTMGPEQYMRYASLLRYEQLLALVTVDVYSYAVEYLEDLDRIFGILGLEEVETARVRDRINAYQFNFEFYNLAPEPVTDLELVSFFKADLYLNETGINDDLTSLLDFSYDDTVAYDASRELFYVWDENNATTFDYPWNHTAMGFNSTSHAISEWEVGPALDLLVNLTVNHTLANNRWAYTPHQDDPGFAAVYSLAPTLTQNQHVGFEGILGIGQGSSQLEAYASMVKQMDLLRDNTTTYNVTDIMVVEVTLDRIVYQAELYHSRALFVNGGTTVLDTVELAFMANRTNAQGALEIFTVAYTRHDVQPGDLIELSADWFPLYRDVYAVGWVSVQVSSPSFDLADVLAGDLDALLGEAETAYLNNFFVRNVFVVNRSQYAAWAVKTLEVTPHSTQVAPLTLHHPLDFALVNLTAVSVAPISHVNISMCTLGDAFVTINQSYYDVLEPFTRIQLLVMIPPVTPPGQYSFDLFITSNGTLLFDLVTEMDVKPSRGRVFFDFIHSSLFELLRGTQSLEDYEGFGEIAENVTSPEQLLDRFWGERLQSTFGNFFELKELWATRAPLGATMQTLIPLIEINMSELFNVNSLPEEASSFLGEDPEFGGDRGINFGIGPYYFESTQLTTNYINHDILQFFDVLVIQDPEANFTTQELVNITSWVEAGGVLMVFAENETENDVDGLNDLLANFNLTINGSLGTPRTLNASDWTAATPTGATLSAGVSEVHLEYPVTFSKLGAATNVEFPCAGNVIAKATRGRGKILAVGDADVITNLGLSRASNVQFANNCWTWAMARHFDFTLAAQNDVIPLGSQDFFYLRLNNVNETGTYLDDQFLAIAAFVDENGTAINAEIIGFQIPIMPFLQTDTGYLGTYFDSQWAGRPGTYHIQVILDHPAMPSEILFYTFQIQNVSAGQVFQDYIFPGPGHPQVFDVIGIFGVVIMACFLWLYVNFKNKRRLQITQLKGETLYQARTLLGEARAIIKQLDVGLSTENVDEIERLRLLFASRKRLRQFLETLKQFGDRLGEYY